MVHRCIFIACVLLGGVQNNSRAQPVTQLTVGEAHSILRVVCYRVHNKRPISSVGTGFLHKSGVVITAAHAVKDCFSISLHTATRDTIIARTVATVGGKHAIDEVHDIALLFTADKDTLKGTPIPLGVDSNRRLGEPMSGWGFPTWFGMGKPHATYGFVTGTRLIRARWTVLTFDAHFNPGMSGGPILDNRKTVFAMMVRKYNPHTQRMRDYEEWLKGLKTDRVWTGNGDTLEVGEVLVEVLRFYREQHQPGMGYGTRVEHIIALLKEHHIDP